MWITFSDPYAGIGYDTPRRPNSKVTSYIVAHNFLRAHAQTYQLYKTRYNQGKIII